MDYTKEQLSKMSNAEIDFEVAKKLYTDGRQIKFYETHVVLEDPGFGWATFSPTRCWGDVMPIAMNNALTVNNTGAMDCVGKPMKEWIIIPNKENPKRAICEVFLMLPSNS